MRDVGNLGEATFESLCFANKAVPNGSKIDKNGWDFLVEIPHTKPLSMDSLHKPYGELKIQVKSTDNDKKSVRFKLSSLYNLIKYNGPSFMILMNFKGSSRPKKIHIIHIDETWINEVLRKVALEISKDPDAKLNKQGFYVNFSRGKTVSETELFDYMFQCVGDDMGAYIEGKANLLESAGYGEVCGKVKFKTNNAKQLTELTNLFLGIEQYAKIEDCSLSNIRFDIETEVHPPSSAIISPADLKPTALGKTYIQEDELSPPIAIDSELYISPTARIPKIDIPTIRVKSHFFDIFLKTTKSDAEFNLFWLNIPDTSRRDKLFTNRGANDESET